MLVSLGGVTFTRGDLKSAGRRSSPGAPISKIQEMQWFMMWRQKVVRLFVLCVRCMSDKRPGAFLAARPLAAPAAGGPQTAGGLAQE